MFRKSPDSTQQQQTNPQGASMNGSTFSVLGADTLVKGNVTASIDLHLDGRIEGDVTCASLVQGESSEIVGAITADTARLHGRVRGTVTVSALIIGKSARIEGDVHYETLSIEQGAQVEGRLSQRSSEPKLLTSGVSAMAKD